MKTSNPQSPSGIGWVSEALVVAQRTPRRIADKIEIPVANRPRLERELQRRLHSSQRFFTPFAFGNIDDDSQHTRGTSFDRPVNPAAGREPVYGLVRPDHAELGAPVQQSVNGVLEASLNLLPILRMNMTDKGLPSPLGLWDRFAVPETSVVAERPTRCVAGKVKIPVANLAGFQRKFQSRLGLLYENLLRYVKQNGSGEGASARRFRSPLHPDSMAIVLAAKFEDDATRFIAATYGREGVAQAPEVLGRVRDQSVAECAEDLRSIDAQQRHRGAIGPDEAGVETFMYIRNRRLIEEVAEFLT